MNLGHRIEAAAQTSTADIDRVKAAKLGVPPERVFEAMQVYLGRLHQRLQITSAEPIRSLRRLTAAFG